MRYNSQPSDVRGAGALLIVMLVATGCGMGDAGRAPADALAPSGTLRAALNFANNVLARRNTAGGEPGGVAPELARELGRRLGVPVTFVPYDSAAAMADAAPTGAWDIAFLAADPAREATIEFSPPYLELDATYLVPAGAPFRSADDVDAPGVRIAARPRSAYDLFLRRSLKAATLVYPGEGETDLDVLQRGRADVLAGLRHALADTTKVTPDVRVVEGRFAAMQQAIGVPQGRPAAAAYLREFVEDVKASGLVTRAVEASGAPGVRVAPSVEP